ncbi:MAG: DsbA family oxidoreductase [Solirubrobacteraceae bacterium]
MSVEQAQASERRLTDAAAADGLEYHLERSRLGSTFDAHRLLALAKLNGLQDALEERLFRARFTEGRLVSDPQTLVDAALEVGLAEAEVRAALASDRFAQEVRADERDAAQMGISGVPMFVVDRRFGVSGAQPAEQLLALLRHGWEQGAATPEPEPEREPEPEPEREPDQAA